MELWRSSVQQKRLWLFTICVFLLVPAVMPARPHPRAALKASTVFTKDQMEIGDKLEKEVSKDNKDCGDDMDEEECLDRRTLAAHTDYIYTQHHKKP